ncbi:hypothetical protein F4778DRAFT_776583 [Xylariomycetidae sp. FL2044]|nr:hypothetical protein F4778DRAFT_776583 [Xylariomycetidae sp. FL2044]
MNPDIKRILTFWYDRNPIEWIIAPDGLDTQMKTEFGDLVRQARGGELDDWGAKPEGSVALVVLLDQFSRNLHRGSPDAFGGDAKACDTASKAIARGFDQEVTVIQASSFYMALLQQESLVSAIAARCLFEKLATRCADQKERDWVNMGIAGAKRHMQQLEQFGRYPTRNILLGRVSTEAEEEFLRQHKPSLK